MLLHEEHARPLWVHGDVMNAVADLGVGIGNVLRAQTAIDRFPGLAAIVGAKCARRGNRDPHSVGIAGIEQDCVQAHTARTRLPLGPRAMSTKSGEFVPTGAAVG